MRSSFAPSVAVLSSVLFASLASFALVACGGETASLGSQGSEQGEGGKAGAGGNNGVGGTNAGGSANVGGGGAAGGPSGCAILLVLCDDNKQYKTYSDNGCQRCAACPEVPPFLGDCPNGVRDVRDAATGCFVKTLCKDDVPCPDIAPPHPDLCKGGIPHATTDTKGCNLAPTCECPSEPACGPNTKAVPRPNGACGSTCEPSACPEVIEPGPNQCPSGGFVPKYNASGCISGFDCKSCPLLGDPSFCSNGTIRVGIKDGQCDYGNVSCQSCNAAQPPLVNWCNDGVIAEKQDGKCLSGAECHCPSYAPCPPDSVTLPIPGSFCGAFDCVDVACPTPPQPTETCIGDFMWAKDAKGCATQAVCNPPN